MSPRAVDFQKKLTAFMEEHIYDAEAKISAHALQEGAARWTISPEIPRLQKLAKEQGLWNLWIPKDLDPKGELGQGLTNQEYATLAEIMGAVPWASEIFNCSAPDTGNMEVLLKYGTEEQKAAWLPQLLDGRIRSCFAMTEPAVASSDATNIEASITKEGAEYVLQGHKWWTSGAMDPRCKMCIFMGKTDLSAPRHAQQSMIIVPFDAAGIKVVRPLLVFGFDDAPHGHTEVRFDQVRVPASNLLVAEGHGFKIAQGRLGPGRIHHCMRLIGLAERALQLLCKRASLRKAFGKPLADQGMLRRDVGMLRCEIDQARLLVLEAARSIDEEGGVFNPKARQRIAMIKFIVPQMASKVIDRAIQVHGGGGVSSDFPLAFAYAQARSLQLADGPDEVHLNQVAKMELARYSEKKK